MSKQLNDIMSRVPAATPRTVKALEASPALTIVPQAVPPVGEPPAAPEAIPAAAPKAKRAEETAKPAKVAQAAPAEREQPLQAYVPASVRKAVVMHAAANDMTTRSIILQGLRAIGFDISDDQIRDRRR